MRLLVVITLLIQLSTYCIAQNLVPNPGFEQYDTCFPSNSDLHWAPPWYTPTAGNPDRYHECENQVPQNGTGNQLPRHGKGYVGGYYWGEPFIPNVREYLQIALLDTLEIGVSYYMEFYISLADISKYACDAIGAYFSDSAVGSLDYFNLPYTPQIENDSGNIISDKTNWTKISGWFTASGGERYLTIGNFKPDSTTQSLLVGGGMNADYAYYYIDDVCVATDSLTCACQHPPQTFDFQASKTIIAENTCISFTIDSFVELSNFYWQFEGAETTTDTAKNPTNICYPDPGLYTVTLFASDGACDTIKIKKPQYIKVGPPDYVNDHTWQRQLLLHPNPCHTTLFLDLNEVSNSTVSNVTLYNTSGQMVGQFTPDNAVIAIPCKAYQAGLYFLRIIDTDGAGHSYKLLIN